MRILLFVLLFGIFAFLISTIQKYAIYFIVFFLISILIYLIYEFIFWKTHQRPLSKEEVFKLSNIRKVRYINEHFKFSRNTYNINPNYRSCLNKSGRWDNISIPNHNILSFLTALLKYKRHEWWVYLLADDNTGRLVWANKGPNNESCYFTGNILTVLNLAKKHNCHTVIHIHNHPHTLERYWNLLSPSDTDLETSKKLKDFCNSHNLNFINAVCSQGSFLIYDYCFDSFFPKGSSQSEIFSENNLSPRNNYILHKEIRKWGKIKIDL